MIYSRLRVYVKRSLQVTLALRLRAHVRFFVKLWPCLFCMLKSYISFPKSGFLPEIVEVLRCLPLFELYVILHLHELDNVQIINELKISLWCTLNVGGGLLKPFKYR